MTVTEYIAGLDGETAAVAAELRGAIDAAMPEGTGAVWHGHPVWSLGAKPGQTPVCFIKAYKNHVALGFWRGGELAAPGAALDVNPRGMGSLKVRALADVDTERFTAWVREALALEN
ncbi:DUF1801 domain-containing protein [Phytomonospora sp. NPDC050363]|uniref:DUF1801 domain-containing protein n=1 Tax=Phytomonospora sp. NPDC050363 TaxID=3155642 RepID=UPI00340B439A